MSVKKQFLKSKPVCKLTFKFEKKADLRLESVKVLGSFNHWDQNTKPMKALKSGDFTQTIELDTGSDIQFRYLINDTIWLNNDDADDYVDAGLGNSEQNGIVHL